MCILLDLTLLSNSVTSWCNTVTLITLAQDCTLECQEVCSTKNSSHVTDVKVLLSLRLYFVLIRELCFLELD